MASVGVDEPQDNNRHNFLVSGWSGWMGQAFSLLGGQTRNHRTHWLCSTRDIGNQSIKPRKVLDDRKKEVWSFSLLIVWSKRLVRILSVFSWRLLVDYLNKQQLMFPKSYPGEFVSLQSIVWLFKKRKEIIEVCIVR